MHFCLSFAVILLHRPIVNGDTMLEHVGPDPDTSINKLVECQGDCDSNSDCSQDLHLACFQRNDGESGPPGCGGIPFENYDYCYDIRPPIENIGIDPDTSVNKLEVCQGDCDNDADCAGISTCLDGPPDCSGFPTDQWQYCSDPRPVYQNLGDDPDTSINKLIDCQGDCDSDNDCIGHLTCFQRDGDASGPTGCSGSPLRDYDYCYDPNTKTPTSTPTGEPSVSVPPTPKPSTRTPTSTPTDVPSDLPTPNGNDCDGLSKANCKVKNICSYGKNKISGACEAKRSKYEHDCAQYQTSDMCLNDAHAGLCDYVDDVCTHVCYGLKKKNCKKLKHITDNKKMCKSPKIANPCKGCHLSTKCG